jgi:hypothetical protein
MIDSDEAVYLDEYHQGMQEDLEEGRCPEWHCQICGCDSEELPYDEDYVMSDEDLHETHYSEEDKLGE